VLRKEDCQVTGTCLDLAITMSLVSSTDITYRAAIRMSMQRMHSSPGGPLYFIIAPTPRDCQLEFSKESLPGQSPSVPGTFRHDTRFRVPPCNVLFAEQERTQPLSFSRRRAMSKRALLFIAGMVLALFLIPMAMAPTIQGAPSEQHSRPPDFPQGVPEDLQERAVHHPGHGYNVFDGASAEYLDQHCVCRNHLT
jgi:hypothetical protein